MARRHVRRARPSLERPLKKKKKLARGDEQSAPVPAAEVAPVVEEAPVQVAETATVVEVQEAPAKTARKPARRRRRRSKSSSDES